MKDSGVEWLGEIPESWIISKVKYSSAFINGFAFDSDQFSIDGKYPVIRIGDFQSNQINYNIANKIDDNSNLENYRILENDILIAMSGATVGKIAYVSKVDFPSYINQRVGIIRNDNPNFSSKYVYYSLLSPEFIKYIFYTSFGSTQPNVSGDTIMDYYITFSSLEQQEKTSLFLDLKTYGIKSLIDNLNNQIDKLKEYKKALITKCVTKGLDSNVPLKDSGIDWIGEIPENWTICKCKYLFSYTKQIVGNGVLNFERLALTLNGVIKRSKDDDNGLQPTDFSTYQILRANQLVFKLIDLQNVSTSRVGLSSFDGIVSPAYIILEPSKSISPKFAEQYFLMLWHRQIFNQLGDAGVRSSLNASDLLNVPFVLPPIDAQNNIANYLDKKCSEIDTLISSKQQQIDKLNEYQKSLIYEYVTGKKEVV